MAIFKRRYNFQTITRWWFQIFVYFHPYLGRRSNLSNIFPLGWNHQPDNFGYTENISSSSHGKAMFGPDHFCFCADDINQVTLLIVLPHVVAATVVVVVVVVVVVTFYESLNIWQCLSSFCAFFVYINQQVTCSPSICIMTKILEPNDLLPKQALKIRSFF